MKFGIVLTPVHGRETPPDRHIAEHVEAAQLAEQLGFSTIVAGQHFLGSELRFYQPVPYLTYLSTKVPTMEMATGVVLLSLVNPVDIAEQVATMDVVTGGRAIFGVGLGYSDHEYGAFGLERSQRVSRFEESIALVRQLWASQPVEFDGKFFQLSLPTPSVQPIQKRLPMWIGAQAEPSVRRAGRLGESWYAAPFPNNRELRELASMYFEERAANNHTAEIEFPVRRDLVIAPTREAAIEQAYERSRARYATYKAWGLDKKSGAPAGSSFADLDREQIEQRFILGTAEECAEELMRLRDEIGMTNFIYKPHWQGFPHLESMRQLEEFGTRIAPLLQSTDDSVAP
jgi:alkanesulfonate monooxygenase SsuD/methylene tetrahydromethanopterin reductase-like flavin-dependent oxidoreductase (luciferase family)